MAETRNIQIPITLFGKIIVLLEYMDIANYEFPKSSGFQDILMEFRKKQNSINRHSAYTNILRAKDDEQRYVARKAYMQLKKKF